MNERKIADIIAGRRSPRAYDPEKPVAREMLLSLFEAARWAPSCYGEEPWRYLVWDRFADAGSWERAFSCLVPGNQVWAKNAPVLMLSMCDNRFSHNGARNRFCEHDTGLASENLVLQAHALGLYAHQMGGYEPDKVRNEFYIPDEFTLLAMIAIGHPGNPETLPAELQEKEYAARSRKPIASRFFDSEWGSGF